MIKNLQNKVKITAELTANVSLTSWQKHKKKESRSSPY